MKKLIFIVIMGMILQNSFAQEKKNLFKKVKADSLKRSKAIPIAVGAIGLGCALEFSTNTKHWWSNKYSLQTKLRKAIPNFYTTCDDYLRYGPLALALGLNLSGRKSEHKIMGQIARYATAHLLMDAVVGRTKKWTAHIRPDGSGYNSFPSGHTAQAFCAARFLDKEFGRDRPWVRWLGYSMAVTTGACRVLKNKHWVSDVLIGAGVGILSVDLTYFVFDKISQKKKLMISPVVGRENYGMTLVYRF
ncbi:MAG: phosphatase PAP2 family protein [Marinifilaceae bacterium]